MIRRFLFIICIIFAVTPFYSITAIDFIKSVKWSGQNSLRFALGGKVIYVDPFDIKAADKADIILITHSHGDHLDKKSIDKIATDKTLIYAPEDCLNKLKSYKNIKSISPDESITVGKINIKAVRAYNIKKKNHPKENNWLGFVIKADGLTVYITGDTERIPEMKDIVCDIIFLPLGQTYTFNSVDEAVSAALDTKAKYAVPVHYGLYEGTEADAEAFEKKLKGKINVKLLIRE